MAERLGYESPHSLELLLSGEDSLPYQQADAICNLFGLCRDWLLSGTDQPFYQKARYRKPHDLFTAFSLDKLRSETGEQYTLWAFVLSDYVNGRAGVYGRRDDSCYRFDLLLTDVPITDQVGGEGTRDIFNFALALVAMCSTEWRRSPAYPTRYVRNSSLILTAGQFDQLVSGEVHPSVLLGCHGDPGSFWVDDLWELDRPTSSAYTQNYQAARQVFLAAARGHGITNNEQLFKLVEDQFIGVGDSG